MNTQDFRFAFLIWLLVYFMFKPNMSRCVRGTWLLIAASAAAGMLIYKVMHHV